MSFEEAYEILIMGIAPNPTANNECIDVCKIAVAKQIPKRVHITYQVKTGKPVESCCPSCGKSVIGSGFYCGYCGQHLDWEQEESQ